MEPDRPILTGLLPDEISALLSPSKAAYRGMQIFRWIHERGADTFDGMTNLPKEFRAEMAERFAIGALTLRTVTVSADRSTDKYLWECRDGSRIESVIIRDKGRTTACISSQVGCRMNCAFCRTGGMGFTRDLTAGEIVDQLIRMEHRLAEDGDAITNIVFMGMGEPLDNLDTVLKAITVISHETGLSITHRKVTISTCGLIPGIDRLGERFRRMGLAVSLNATTDELRSRLMPVNRTYPLGALLDSLERFTHRTRQRVTFEYILMDGINDSPADACRLLNIVRRIPSKINLITYNPCEGSPFRRPPEDRVLAFQHILIDGHATAMIRKSRGDDILAACGQLAADPDCPSTTRD